jgi:nucleotide-binding universal stress UspA family protein
MEIKKIVWACDGSEESELALKQAVFLAEKYKSEIFGLYVSEIYTVTPSIVGPMLYEYQDKAEEEQKENFSSLKAQLSDKGLYFEGKIVKGKVSTEIVKYTDSKEADLVIMGTRGHGLLDSMLIGSTTLNVLRNSKIPVLAHKRGKRSTVVEINNILVPLEIIEKSGSALVYALNLAKIVDADITVFNAVISGGYSYALPTNILEESMIYAHKELEKIILNVKSREKFSDRDLEKIKISVKTSYGPNYGVSISDYANKKNMDLIVIHTHGKKGIEKLMLGSVTELVIRKAQCSVLALKP